MTNEFIKKVKDTVNAYDNIILEAEKELKIIVKEYFENNPIQTVNLITGMTEEKWFEHNEYETTIIDFYVDNVNINVEFNFYIDHTFTCVITSSLGIPKFIWNDIPKDIILNMFYKGKLSRKKIIHVNSMTWTS